MTEDRLTLAQWLSPAFPVSAFAYSHGLEAAIEAGDVTDAAGLSAWLVHLLERGSGWADAVLLSRALDGDAPEALAAEAAALAASRERWEETCALGSAFLSTTEALGAPPVTAMPYPIALGLRARGLALPREEVLALYLQAIVATQVSAAVRFVPLGQTEGQAVLSGLAPQIAACAARAASASLSDIASASFRADLRAMQHETQDVRIFRT